MKKLFAAATAGLMLLTTTATAQELDTSESENLIAYLRASNIDLSPLSNSIDLTEIMNTVTQALENMTPEELIDVGTTIKNFGLGQNTP